MTETVAKRIVVGSTAFFKNIEGFESKDIDVLLFIDNPKDFNIERQIRLNKPVDKCVFEFRNGGKDFLIEHSLKSTCGMVIGKFLVPDVAEYLEMTIDDLKKLEPLLEKLDQRHFYERLIFEYYLKNNEFKLTDEQLMNVYNEYLKYKKK